MCPRAASRPSDKNLALIMETGEHASNLRVIE